MHRGARITPSSTPPRSLRSSWGFWVSKGWDWQGTATTPTCALIVPQVSPLRRRGSPSTTAATTTPAGAACRRDRARLHRRAVGGLRWYPTLDMLPWLWRPLLASSMVPSVYGAAAAPGCGIGARCLQPHDRAYRQAEKVARRCDPKACWGQRFPEKPKWMRWPTYDRLAEQHDWRQRSASLTAAVGRSRTA